MYCVVNDIYKIVLLQNDDLEFLRMRVNIDAFGENFSVFIGLRVRKTGLTLAGMAAIKMEVSLRPLDFFIVL